MRAVDTATHPEYQGRGIFTRLTHAALDELEREGVAFVFNTPNDQSRPGYLKMGWDVVGRLPVLVRPRSVRRALRMLRARTPAGRWSEPTAAGDPAADVLVDHDAVAALLASRPPTATLRTHASHPSTSSGATARSCSRIGPSPGRRGSRMVSRSSEFGAVAPLARARCVR